MGSHRRAGIGPSPRLNPKGEKKRKPLVRPVKKGKKNRKEFPGEKEKVKSSVYSGFCRRKKIHRKGLKTALGEKKKKAREGKKRKVAKGRKACFV